MNQDYDDLRALYRKARSEEEPTLNDKRAVRVALVSAGTAVATFHTATAAGKLLAIIPGAGKVLTIGQVVLYASLGAAVGGLAAVGATVSNRTPAARVGAIAPAHTQPRAPTWVSPSAPKLGQVQSVATAGPSHVTPAEVEYSRTPVMRASAQSNSKNTLPPPAREGVMSSDAERTAFMPTPASSAEQPSLVDESRALATVQSALNAQDGTSALGLLDLQDREFANGSLVPERAAARILALCATGRMSEARSASERFLQSYPGSPLVRRIKAACEK